MTQIRIVTAHAEGEVGNVIVGGVEPPPGSTLWEQSRFIHEDGTLRDVVLNEPRGGVFVHCNLIVPAKDPRAAFGFIIMEPEHTPPMSGSNSICVATVLLETGMVPMQEPITWFVLEAPGGCVKIEARCKDGKALSIQTTNVPSFVDQLDQPLEVPGYGTVLADTAFGGDSFVLVNASDFGLSITPDNAGELARLGARITSAANTQIGFTHPELPDWSHISFCQFVEPVVEIDGVKTGKNTVTIDPGKLDRSPTGTGCSARMAVMRARGELQVGDKFRGLSILDTTFECCVERDATVGDRPAIVPSLKGRAWRTGELVLNQDPTDPFPRGYRLSDTWPRMAKQ